MKKFISVVSVVFLTLCSLSGFAWSYGERYPGPISPPNLKTVVIDYFGEEFSEDSILHIKSRIKDEHPRIDIKDFNLVEVKLVAKTRFNRGVATLKVGSHLSRRYEVNGNPRDFDIDRPYTWDRVEIKAPVTPGYNDDKEVWQILLLGNFKVQRVTATLRPKMVNQRVLEVDLNDKIFTGQDKIYLKFAISQRYPYLNLDRLVLQNVELVAKSRMGIGVASLQIGSTEGRYYNIEGNPRDFDSSNPRTYDSINMTNYSGYSSGVWQINLRGQIKVKKVLVYVKNGRLF